MDNIFETLEILKTNFKNQIIPHYVLIRIFFKNKLLQELDDCVDSDVENISLKVLLGKFEKEPKETKYRFLNRDISTSSVCLIESVYSQVNTNEFHSDNNEPEVVAIKIDTGDRYIFKNYQIKYVKSFVELNRTNSNYGKIIRGNCYHLGYKSIDDYVEFIININNMIESNGNYSKYNKFVELVDEISEQMYRYLSSSNNIMYNIPNLLMENTLERGKISKLHRASKKYNNLTDTYINRLKVSTNNKLDILDEIKLNMKNYNIEFNNIKHNIDIIFKRNIARNESLDDLVMEILSDYSHDMSDEEYSLHTDNLKSMLYRIYLKHRKSNYLSYTSEHSELIKYLLSIENISPDKYFNDRFEYIFNNIEDTGEMYTILAYIYEQTLKYSAYRTLIDIKMPTLSNIKHLPLSEYLNNIFEKEHRVIFVGNSVSDKIVSLIYSYYLPDKTILVNINNIAPYITTRTFPSLSRYIVKFNLEIDILEIDEKYIPNVLKLIYSLKNNQHMDETNLKYLQSQVGRLNLE